jgi:hypothetical protein
MQTRVPSLIATAVLAGSLASCARSHPPASQRPEVPAGLALPEGEEAALRLDARGTQNYECRPKRDAPAETEWALVAPEAELFDGSGKKVGKHYAGPTWESIEDGSKVVGTVRARADAPAPDAIPWLLLSATETSAGGMLGGVKSIQRIDTRGGKPPAGACAAGEVLKVPYAAVYWFSRARR